MKIQLTIMLFLIGKVFAQVPANIESELVILNVKTKKEMTILSEKRHFEAPNWSRDGKFLLINADGFLEKIDLQGNNLGKIFPETVRDCNNDHGLSFDGKTLIISRNDEAVPKPFNSRIYKISLENGSSELLTENYPSYWHGISPDSKTVVYCAKRGEKWEVMALDVATKQETQLTDSEGLDDGPEYSYDGNWIYFNSHRSGRMHLYRMKPNGTNQEQLTTDELDNWFPHPSPDNQKIVYISYLQDQKGQHPFGKDVKLRMMNLKNRKIKDLTPVFYGGQGTMNVPSWSPNGKYIAFVRYRKP